MPVPRVSRRKATSRIPESDTDLAHFIAERAREPALLAGNARWPLLTYFLNMARIEAEARMVGDAPIERRRPNPRARVE